MLPRGFVDVSTVVPNIVVDLRYAGRNNFVGEPIEGYSSNKTIPKAILSSEAAACLRLVQETLQPFGLGLKIYDAYRPQQAVDHFVRWAADPSDTKMKAEYYPAESKQRLFSEGYIASRSGHSRGSTVDLTIISLDTNEELDMGAPFDLFDPVSWATDATISGTCRAHRALLRTAMVTNGFSPYEKEWWHFTLTNEPYPDTYFNFTV